MFGISQGIVLQGWKILALSLNIAELLEAARLNATSPSGVILIKCIFSSIIFTHSTTWLITAYSLHVV